MLSDSFDLQYVSKGSSAMSNETVDMFNSPPTVVTQSPWVIPLGVDREKLCSLVQISCRRDDASCWTSALRSASTVSFPAMT